MSRIGRVPIKVPQGVAVDIKESEISVKGPKGELSRRLHEGMAVKLDDGTLVVSRPNDDRLYRALHGLTRTLLANMVEGVSKGFEKGLDITGVGYRAEKTGDKLVIRIGFSQQVEVSPMAGVALGVEGGTHIKVTGIDKETVGEMAARIKAIRPADSYKGKGIKYTGEVIRLKAGKVGKAIGKRA